MVKKVAFVVTAISLAVDLIIVASVVLNLAWVRTYAAGGQYTTFPTNVRVMYIFQVGFVLVVGWFLWKIRNGAQNVSDSKFALAVLCIYAISTASQIISKSPHERLNAIPAALIMWGFFVLRKE